MKQRSLAANTIRQRAYLVRAWLGVEKDVALPARRTIRETKWLDADQIRAMLSVIPKEQDGRHDFALLVALLVTGLRVGQVRMWKRSEIRCSGGSAKVRKWNVPKVVCGALQAAFEPDDQPLSPQEINRRIGRSARMAGLEPQGVTAECLRRICKELGQHAVITLVQDALANRNVQPVCWKRVDRDVRLHGIGRRSG